MNNTLGNSNFSIYNQFNSVSSKLNKIEINDLSPDTPVNLTLTPPSLLFSAQSSFPNIGNSLPLQNIFDDNAIDNKPKEPVRMASPVNNSIKGKVMGTAEGTGYYPHNSRLEGGYVDKIGKKLNTLQDFLSGKASYVSIALDKNLYKKGVIKYGDKFRIPELEKKYGRQIEFRAVDTGGAFTNKKFNRVDICTRSEKDSLDKTVNGKLTLIKTN